MIETIIRRAEREIRVSLDYLREIARHSRSAFWKLLLMRPVLTHRKSLPVAMWHAARIAVTQRADCGTCVQAAVNQAINDGVDAKLLEAIVRRDPHLSSEVREIITFVEASLDGAEEIAAPLRARVAEQYGQAALVDLALGVATTQVFPTLKKVLGVATSCSLVRVDFGLRAESAESKR